MVEVPLLAFCYKLPADGLPILHSWYGVLKDILYRGFESWREVMEVKCVDGTIPFSQPLDYGKVHAVKGMGRISMLLWAVVHTYTHCRNSLSLEDTADLARR